MSKKVAQVIIETLKEAGVEHCYGIVGDTLNAFASRSGTGRHQVRSHAARGSRRVRRAG